MQPEAADQTDNRWLVPPPADAGVSQRAGLVFKAGVDYRAKYRGALIGGAIGDALGRPWEGRGPSAAQAEFESLGRYRKWSGWKSGPTGTVTDDTQLTMSVGDSICALGYLDPEDLSRRFVEWLAVGRGKGAATVEAVTALHAGTAWFRAGARSAGNGAAMRVAPIGLRNAADANAIRRDGAISALITHATEMAVVSAIAQAFMVAQCLHLDAGDLTTDGLRSKLLNGLAIVLDGVAEEAVPERRRDRPGLFRLRDRLTEVASRSFAAAADAFEYFHNGAFVLESLPAALWCFLRHWDDPGQAILTAVSGGYDADTVAALTGTLVGALHGEGGFPSPWLDELEYVEELRSLGDRLLALAVPSLPPDRGAPPGDRPASENEVPSAASGTAPWPPGRSDRILGCLLGGAVGDALGAPIEFSTLSEIRSQYGPAGVAGFAAGGWSPGIFTDDTQMTLFTAEGLIRAQRRYLDRGVSNVPMAIWHAYQRWLDTQGYEVPWDSEFPRGPSGWLVAEPALRHQRSPGHTCLSALRTGLLGSPDAALNDSKGCGGVMRVAPIGLVAEDPFELACEAAALTHGHPSGYLAAGVFAMVVGGVAHGASVRASIDPALESLCQCSGHEEVLKAVQRALALAASGREPSPEAVETLGGGWVAEEALAIALYCALVTSDFRTGVLLAVNHSGDSDSTGSMVGNLMGAALGLGSVPAEWLTGLDARPIVERVAHDLAAAFAMNSDDANWDLNAYPPW